MSNCDQIRDLLALAASGALEDLAKSAHHDLWLARYRTLAHPITLHEP